MEIKLRLIALKKAWETYKSVMGKARRFRKMTLDGKITDY